MFHLEPRCLRGGPGEVGIWQGVHGRVCMDAARAGPLSAPGRLKLLHPLTSPVYFLCSRGLRCGGAENAGVPCDCSVASKDPCLGLASRLFLQLYVS